MIPEDRGPYGGLAFNEFRTTIFDTVAELGEQFDNPEDDWEPVCFMEFEAKGAEQRLKDLSKEGVAVSYERQPGEALRDTDRGLALIPIPFEVQAYLDKVVIKLAEIATETRARKVALITNTWQRLLERMPEEFDIPAYEGKEAGARIEVLCVHFMDEEVCEEWVARIDRVGPVPTLTKWGRVPTEPQASAILAPLIKALR